jgi:hypothetical protein
MIQLEAQVESPRLNVIAKEGGGLKVTLVISEAYKEPWKLLIDAAIAKTNLVCTFVPAEHQP